METASPYPTSNSTSWLISSTTDDYFDEDDDDDDNGRSGRIAPTLKNALIGVAVFVLAVFGTIIRRKFFARRRQREPTNSQAPQANGTVTSPVTAPGGTAPIFVVSGTTAPTSDTSQFSSGIEYSNNNFLSNYSNVYSNGNNYGK